MKDRVPKYPGRIKLVHVSGDIYDMTRADEPTQAGTPLNKSTLLSDATASALGLTGDPTVDDAFRAIVTNPYIWDGPKRLKSLSAGSLVKLNEDAQAKKFIVLGKNHYGSGTGVTLIRKDSFTPTAWNAASTGFQNHYMGCTLDNICDGIWPQKLDPEIRECIVPVPIIVAEGNGVTTLHTIYRKAFALSCTEVGLTGWQTEGTAFPYFSDNAKRICYVDESSCATDWGLRSPASNASSAHIVYYDGTMGNGGNVYGPYFAARPAFNLRPDMVISSVPDSDGCYTFLKREDA